MRADDRRQRILDALQGLRAWGVPGLLGALLFIAAIGTEFAWRPRLARDLQALSGANAQQVLGARVAAAGRHDATARPPARAFLESFPAVDSRDAQVGRLFDLMQKRALTFGQARFSYASLSPLDIVEYQITLPVRGTYASIRAFVVDALLGEPTLSLDSLHLHRMSIDAPDLEAEMVWSVHTRADPRDRPETPAAPSSAAAPN